MSALFKLRPDIFIQRVPEKLRIHRKNENYILNLSDEKIDLIIDFIEKADGTLCIEKTIENYPVSTHKLLRKIVEFLIDKDLAFLQKEAQVDTDPNLEMVHRYLAQHTDDTLAAHRKFSEKHFLLIADDITLLAMLRSLAELGAQNVSFAVSNTSFASSAQQLKQYFIDSATCPQARVAEVKLSSLAKNNTFNVIVSTEPSIMAQLPAHNDQAQYIAHYTDKQLLLSKVAITPSAPLYCPAKTQRLIAGSVIGTIIFDDLVDVRAFCEHEYAYYSLDAPGTLRFAYLQPVASVNISSQTNAESIDVISSIHTLCNQPLCPILSCEQQIHEVDLIAIQKVTVQHHNGTENVASSYYGIGLNEQDAIIDALESFVSAEQKWLINDVNYPHIKQRLAQRNHQTALRLVSPVTDSAPNTFFSKQAEFLRFCINTVFCCDTVIIVSEVDGRKAIQISAAEHCVYGPAGADKELQLERLLMRLYLNLWLAENRRNVVRKERVADFPLLITREACNEQSRTTSIA